MKPLLVFDYDGTINETMRIYEPALRKAFKNLVDKGLMEDRELTNEEIASYLGLNSVVMWTKIGPNLTVEQRKESSNIVGKVMRDLAEDGTAKWYPKAEETLTELKNLGYSMVILSNSRKISGDTHFRCFNMGRWFDRWYDSESFNFQPKPVILKAIKEEYDCPVVMIGDRDMDMEAAKAVGAPFIGCLYGYSLENELSGADYLLEKAEDFAKLPEIIKQIELL